MTDARAARWRGVATRRTVLRTAALAGVAGGGLAAAARPVSAHPIRFDTALPYRPLGLARTPRTEEEPDGGYATTTTAYDPEIDAFLPRLVKTDPAGATQWDRTSFTDTDFPADYDPIAGPIQLPDGGFAFVGRARVAGTERY
jgi:hypothetical protein